jgi:uncharacterized membrane protein
MPRGVDRERGRGSFLPRREAPASRDVEVELSLVEPLPLAERERLEDVVVVRYQGELGVHRLAVDREAERLAVPGSQRERPQPRERVPSPSMALAAVDELRVGAEGDVVQEQPVADAADVDPPLGAAERRKRRDGVVAVETEVAGKVVARSVRHADERKVALECDLGDGRERAVASGDPQGRRFGGPGEVFRGVALAEDARLDAVAPRFVAELLGLWPALAGARVDEEVAGHDGGLGSRGVETERPQPVGGFKPIYLIRGLPGHPLHPPLTDATIGAYTAATVLALLHVFGVSEANTATAWWLTLVIAQVLIGLAAITGFADWLQLSFGTPLWRTATVHFVVMVLTAAIFAVTLFLGHGDYVDGEISAVALILTLIGFGMLTVGGWLGGTIVFVHGMRVLNLVEEPALRAAAPVPTPEKEEAER